jgi:small conductance mechanosensitive channel
MSKQTPEQTPVTPISNAPEFAPTAEWASEAASHYGKSFLDNAINYAPKILAALLVMWIGFAIAKRIKRFILGRVEKSARVDGTLGKFFANMARFAVIIAATLLAVSILGANVAAIMGIFAAMTLAIGLALEGSMSNVAAGLLLIILRPFKIGDYVEVNGQEGTVEDLNVFTTTLRTLDNVKIILANGEVKGSVIKNLTTLGVRRVDVDFGIDYGDDVNKAIDIIKSTASKDSRVLDKPDQPWAKVSCLNDSSVDIQMRVWCKAEDYWDVRFDLIKAVKEAFDKGGISIPYPHVVEIVKG